MSSSSHDQQAAKGQVPGDQQDLPHGKGGDLAGAIKELTEALEDHDSDANDAVEAGERADDWTINLTPWTARAALAALSRPTPEGGEADGWQLVPVAPTPGMIEAASKLHRWLNDAVIFAVDKGFRAAPSAADGNPPLHDWWKAMIAASPAPSSLEIAGLTKADQHRLDWLETMVVEVRTPLPHGSSEYFWSSPDESFEGELRPSDIRARIDAALSASPKGGV